MLRLFQIQRANAERRGIEFGLSFDQWLLIWKKSKRLPQRGRDKNQYVMARKNDRGPYVVSNVKIILNRSNAREAWQNKTVAEIDQWKRGSAKGGYANKGRKRPDLTKLNKSREGQNLSIRHRRNIAASMIGKKRGRYKTWKGIPRC